MPHPDIFLFVSHVSEDRVKAMSIVEGLERRGVKCWIAPRDVRPGRPFDDEIDAAIEGSRAMLLVFSDLCNESEYIRREVTVAGKSQKIIIVFRIEDAKPRLALRVRLSDLHWIDAFVLGDRAIEDVARELAVSTTIVRGSRLMAVLRQAKPERAQSRFSPRDETRPRPAILLFLRARPTAYLLVFVAGFGLGFMWNLPGIVPTRKTSTSVPLSLKPDR